MEYLMLVCVEVPFDPGDPAALERETNSWVDEMETNGIRRAGSRLRPYAEAVSITVKDDKPSTGPGLFGGGRVRIAGFDIIECANEEAALEVASKHPMARRGVIEIRELC